LSGRQEPDGRSRLAGEVQSRERLPEQADIRAKGIEGSLTEQVGPVRNALTLYELCPVASS